LNATDDAAKIGETRVRVAFSATWHSACNPVFALDKAAKGASMKYVVVSKGREGRVLGTFQGEEEAQRFAFEHNARVERLALGTDDLGGALASVVGLSARARRLEARLAEYAEERAQLAIQEESAVYMIFKAAWPGLRAIGRNERETSLRIGEFQDTELRALVVAEEVTVQLCPTGEAPSEHSGRDAIQVLRTFRSDAVLRGVQALFANAEHSANDERIAMLRARRTALGSLS
jgi:hypothetical protein